VQGIAGAYLARVAGLDPRVADAIRDHYKPVGQGDDVPTAPVSVAVALADKLDTLVGFFAIGELPTGSRDPYALRRAMLGVIAMVLKNNLFLDLGDTLRNARTQLVDQLRANENVISINLSEWDLKDRKGPPPILVDCDVSNAVGFFPASADKYGGMGADGWLVWHEAYSGPKHVLFSIADERTVVNELVAFALDRLRGRLRDEGVRPGIVNAFIQQDYASNPIFDADTALAELGIAQKQHRFQQPLQIVNVVAGVRHASAALETETGIAALQAFKRVDSILSAHRSLPVTDLSFDANEPLATTTLATAVQGLTIELQAAVATRDYRKAIYEIGRFKPLIDKFFEAVMVNDPDPDVRARRLALLARFRDAANIVADFSKVEG
jgi:glycyl-tRNA synthetase beta chain